MFLIVLTSNGTPAYEASKSPLPCGVALLGVFRDYMSKVVAKYMEGVRIRIEVIIPSHKRLELELF
jgi:hypothetical protein